MADIDVNEENTWSNINDEDASEFASVKMETLGLNESGQYEEVSEGPEVVHVEVGRDPLEAAPAKIEAVESFKMDNAAVHQFACPALDCKEFFESYEEVQKHCVTHRKRKKSLGKCKDKKKDLVERKKEERLLAAQETKVNVAGDKEIKKVKIERDKEEETVKTAVVEEKKEAKTKTDKKKEQIPPGLCRFCPATFSSAKSRLEHEKIHPEAQKPCEVCGEIFLIGKMSAHMRIHQQIVCYICGKVVRHREMHMQKCHDDEFLCDICNKKLSNKKRLQFHKETMHSTEKVYPCRNCEICFKTKEELDEHDRTAPTRHHVECPVCLEKLGKKEYRHFRVHLLEHAVAESESLEPVKDDDGEESYNCPKCERVFSRLDYLQNHLLAHYVPEWRFECKKCCMAIHSYNILSRHESQCQPSTRMKAGYAAIRGARRKGRIQLSSYAQVQKKKYACPKCNNEYASAHWLNFHIESVHNEKIVCCLCHKVFKTKAEKDEHAQTHRRVYPKYPCCICSKSVRGVNMKFHLLSHARLELKDLTSDKCPKCSREFTNKSEVLNHMLCHYQPQRIFECSHCCLAVKSKLELDMHWKFCEAIHGKKKRNRKKPAEKQIYEDDDEDSSHDSVSESASESEED